MDTFLEIIIVGGLVFIIFALGVLFEKSSPIPNKFDKDWDDKLNSLIDSGITKLDRHTVSFGNIHVWRTNGYANLGLFWTATLGTVPLNPSRATKKRLSEAIEAFETQVIQNAKK